MPNAQEIFNIVTRIDERLKNLITDVDEKASKESVKNIGKRVDKHDKHWSLVVKTILGILSTFIMWLISKGK